MPRPTGPTPAAALLAAALLLSFPARAETFSVTTTTRPDLKAVYARVESSDSQVARARIGGTISAVTVDEGDSVSDGQLLATVGDSKLGLKRTSAEAQVASLRAERAQAATELARAEDLYRQGVIPKARLDQARTAVEVLDRGIAGQLAERQVVEAQTAEGGVLSPGSGRVLQVNVIPGAVVMPGEPIATIATGGYLLRMELPERHARFLRDGATVAVGDRGQTSDAGARTGTVSKVYPRLEDGRVVADVQVAGLGDYFVGERTLVWLPTAERRVLVVPEPFLSVQFGVTFATLADGRRVPVQTGNRHPDGIEVLSGLRDGDQLISP